MNALWRIELLGGFRVSCADRVITRFSTQKTAALLAYLALHPSRSHSRDHLFELLWPECDPDAGRNRLSVALSSLRRQLEPPSLPAGSVIAADRYTVRLAAGAIESDAAEFLRLLDLARSATATEAACVMEAAMGLYAGELLPGFYDDWIESERRRMADRAFQVSRALSDHCARVGDASGSLEWKRRSEALAGWDAVDRPSRNPSSLRTRATAARTAAVAERSQDASTVTSRTEVPLRRAPRRATLPLRPNRFFGREEELAQLGEWLSPASSTRIVTVTGPGGGGKSRLALEAAYRLAGSFEGGVHFVGLAEIIQGCQVPNAVLTAVGGRLESGECPLERLQLALGDRASLLVLDNFEQLVDTGGVEALRELLESAPEARWLLTSRRRLGLQSEIALAVPPLPLPSDAEGPNLSAEQALAYDGVRLFVERAQRARPDFQVTARNAGVIAKICRKLEGLPLALELAAARAQVLSPPQLLATLEERLAVRSELLISRQRDRAPRHRTLEEAIGWSYDLLAPPLQAFFAGLCVFHGGCSASAAAAVCERPDALESLADLADCSLIKPAPSASDQRFEMLEMVREFAADRLPDEALDELRARHAAWFADWLESRVRCGDVCCPLSEVEAEFANIRAALRWVQERAPLQALRIAAAAEPIFHLRGHWAEARTALERALAADTGTPPPQRAEALLALGHIAARIGDRASARSAICEAEALAQENHLSAVEARALRFELRENPEADEARLRRSIALSETLGETRLIAGAAINFGNFLFSIRRLREAHLEYARALELYRNLNDPIGEAQALNNLGAAALDRSEWEEAQALLERALALHRESGDAQGLAMSLFNLGSVCNSLGQREIARLRIAAAQREYEKQGDFGGLILCARILGDMAREVGSFQEAAAELRRGLDMAVSFRDSWAAATLLQGLVPLLFVLDKKRASAWALGAALQAVDGYWERLNDRAEVDARGLRSAMGDCAFETALEEGRRLTWSELTVLADAAGVSLLASPPKRRIGGI